MYLIKKKLTIMSIHLLYNIPLVSLIIQKEIAKWFTWFVTFFGLGPKTFMLENLIFNDNFYCGFGPHVRVYLYFHLPFRLSWKKKLENYNDQNLQFPVHTNTYISSTPFVK